MHIEQKVNIHNRFDVEIRDAKTGELKQKATGFNIVLDQMWTRLCGGSSYFVNIHFGTGGGTLSPSRTSLFTHLGTKTAADEEQVKAIPVSRWKRKIVLNPEEFVGSTITEVGIAFGSTASNLVTHAMLKDSEGNPISITKTDLDVVTIYATVFVTLQSGTVVLIDMPTSNTLVNYLIGGSGAPTGSFGLLSIPGAFTRLGSTANVTWSADIPNKKRKTNISRFDINTGNGHVKAFEFSNMFVVELPKIDIFTGQSYTNVPIGTGDGVKDKFSIPSRNIKQDSISIRIDGVVTSLLEIIEKKNIFIRKKATENPINNSNAFLSGNGKVLAVTSGSSGSPFIQIHDLDSNDNWVPRSVPVHPFTRCDYAALNYDGTVIAFGDNMGAPYVKIYDWTGTEWIARVQPPSLPTFIGSANLSDDGTALAIATSTASPYVKIYDWTGTEWTARVQPPNVPVSAESMDCDKDINVLALASGSYTPYFKIYDWTGTEWIARAQPPSLPTYGRSIALNSNGTVLAVGSSASPYVKIYDWTGSEWIARVQPPSLPTHGYRLSISDDGSILSVTSFNTSPYIKVYDWTGTEWISRTIDITVSLAGMAPISGDGALMILTTGSNFPYVAYFSNGGITEHDIKFNTPPAAGTITADYTVDGVHKTNHYVIDVSFAIAFGEGA